MKYNTLLYVGAIFALALLIPSAMTYAAGTPAGTVITNTAVLSYKDLGGNPYTNDTASVQVTVGQLAGVAVTPGTASQIAGDSEYVYYPVTVTNTGNGPDAFNLTDISSHGWAVVLYQDLNRSHVMNPADSTAGAVTVTSTLAEDSSYYLIAKIFVPSGTASGTVDNDTVRAVSQWGLTTPPGATAYGVYTTSLEKAIFSLTKTGSPSTLQPDQTETYTIAYQDTGNGPALNVVISDTLNTNLTYVASSATGGGTYNGANRTVSWSLGKVNSGGSGSFQFQATVNHGVVAGTVIPNVAVVTFTDSTDGHQKKTPTPAYNITVTQYTALYSIIYPVRLGIADSGHTVKDTIDVGLRAAYEIILWNNGNSLDSAKEALTSSLPLLPGWKLYFDFNGDGIVDGSDSAVNANDLGTLAANGGSENFLAFDTVAHSTPDTKVDTLTVVYTSISNNSTTSTVKGITLIRAPILTLQKTAADLGPIGRYVPGDTILYTISYSNTGTGAGQAIFITDPIPTHTTYVASSTTLNGVAVPDISTTPVNVGTVASGASGNVKFKAIIN
jgi:uncharacterized repeat protein (TIGR01451 family)